MSPYLRAVKTSSGTTAVQIVHSSHRGSRDIEHIEEPDKEPCVTIIGAPSSARAHHVGQETGPPAVRAAGPRGPGLHP